MALREKLDEHKGVLTVWGKLIPEKEAYKYALRQLAAFSANIFQVMRVLEPDWEKRTYAICEAANMVSMSADSNPKALFKYLDEFYNDWNFPEFLEKDTWLGGVAGDTGDEFQNMAGRVIQFTPDRVEKELDTCPWDIVGSEMCNMTTSTFQANFDLNSGGVDSGNGKGKRAVALNMCEARGCGERHCRVVAERLDVFDIPEQDWLDHMQKPVMPVHDTPPERSFTEGQVLRNGSYAQAFGEERTLEWSYNWSCWAGWAWAVAFPLIAIRDMAETEEEFERILKIIFSTAGKNAFIDYFAIDGMRNWLGVPHEIGWNDGRLMGGYIKTMLDIQLVPCELVAFDEDGVEIKVNYDDFTARYPMVPVEEILPGYECLWHNMVKTMVSPEWSVWLDNPDDEDITIVVARKVDERMQ